MWDERFASPEYIYGEKPNEFFKAELSKIQPGELLLPAEGEGRNAVYAASLGWSVTAVDYSREGMRKALQLAKKNGVGINYIISDLSAYFVDGPKFDAIGLVFAHFPSTIRTSLHRRLAASLRTGGTVILEAFSKEQINNDTGGPRSIDLLYSLDEIKEDFKDFSFLFAEELTDKLEEGAFHNGMAHLVRIVAVKE